MEPKDDDQLVGELQQIEDMLAAVPPPGLAPQALLTRRYELRKALAGRRLPDDTSAITARDARGTAFAIMPFRSPFNEYYVEVIKPAALDAGFAISRSDEIFSPGVFVQTIWEQVLGADVVIAEMTTANSNVLYELGLSHAVAKKVIMLTQAIDDVPSDLRHINCIVYDTAKVDWAAQSRNALQRMLLFEGSRAKPVLEPAASVDNTRLFQEQVDEQDRLTARLGDASRRIRRLEEDAESFRNARDSAHEALTARLTATTTAPAAVFEKDGGHRATISVPGSPDPLTMVYIPPGSFRFGGGGNYEDLALSSYWITRYSITNSHFCAFLNAVGNQSESGVPWIDLDGQSTADRCRLRFSAGHFAIESGYEQHPVTYVNFYGAAAFCAWLGGELPTVQQWEKAVRGVDGRDYPWGNSPPTPNVANISDSGWDRDVSPIAVDHKSKGASEFGIVQGIGNVWHWTSTYFPDRDVQAVRGGSYFDFRLGKRQVYRFQVHPDGPDFSQGLVMVKRFVVSVADSPT